MQVLVLRPGGKIGARIYPGGWVRNPEGLGFSRGELVQAFVKTV